MTYYSRIELLQRLHGTTCSGLYYIRVKSVDVIQSMSEDLYREYLLLKNCVGTTPDPLVIYIGKANGQGGLYGRLMHELSHTGPGTFFRGLGAVMGKNPMRATTPRGIHNYRFAEPEKNEIIGLIDVGLEIAVECLSTNEVEAAETNEITTYKPLFNYTHNPCYSIFIRESRERCRRYAAGLMDD